MKKALATAACVCATCLLEVTEAEEQYVDNRSDAAALVHSLYNAINRKEYARAWGYFGGQKPAKDFDRYVSGYSDTQRVDVAIGAMRKDGTAGSTFYQVPIAIRATDVNGNRDAFAGCYTARLANPRNQSPPFRPMHIEKGHLAPVAESGPLSEAIPNTCGNPTPPQTDSTMERIKSDFSVTYASLCASLTRDAESDLPNPNVSTLKFERDDGLGNTVAQLYQFPCNEIGIDNGRPKAGELARGFRLTAADSAGEADAQRAPHISCRYRTSVDRRWRSVRPTAGRPSRRSPDMARTVSVVRGRVPAWRSWRHRVRHRQPMTAG